MSELTVTQTNRKHLRRELLCSAAGVALMAIACSAEPANAADDSRPTVWIELGGQLERMSGQGVVFSPPFLSTYADSSAFASDSPINAQRPPRYSKGFEGKVSFVPNGSDWVFSASLLYSKANSNKRVHQQTAGIPLPTDSALHGNPNFDPAAAKAFSDVRSKDSESHMILDFKVGKDVGLGMFGHGSTSNLSLGVRFAQFSSSKNVEIGARPEVHFYGSAPFKYWSDFTGASQSTRSFHGVGPTVSWDGSAPIVGDADAGITVDWGVGAAALFGRQKANVSHSTTESKFHNLNFATPNTQVYQHNPPTNSRRRSIVVPNVGGFAGVSFRRSNAKISFGYRGDFFFGAFDGGLDSRKSEDVSFHGPFATIAIGWGG